MPLQMNSSGHLLLNASGKAVLDCPQIISNFCIAKYTSTLSGGTWSTPTSPTATYCAAVLATLGTDPAGVWIQDSSTTAHQWLVTSQTCTSAGTCIFAPPAGPVTPFACYANWTSVFTCSGGSGSWSTPFNNGYFCLDQSAIPFEQWVQVAAYSAGTCRFAYQQLCSGSCTWPISCSGASAPATPTNAEGYSICCSPSCQYCGLDDVILYIQGCDITDGSGTFINGAWNLSFCENVPGYGAETWYGFSGIPCAASQAFPLAGSRPPSFSGLGFAPGYNPTCGGGQYSCWGLGINYSYVGGVFGGGNFAAFAPCSATPPCQRGYQLQITSSSGPATIGTWIVY